MRFRLDISLHIGAPDPEPPNERDSDTTGYLADHGDTTTGLGFTGVGPKLGDAFEEDRA